MAYFVRQWVQTPTLPVIQSSSLPSSLPPRVETVTVHVAGAVSQPGLYQVSPQLRVHQVLALAGGVLESAHLDKVNLAAHVKDGKRIWVPFVKKPSNRKSHANTGEASSNHRININTATLQQWCKVPGIGQKTARALVQYRLSRGGFTSLDDLVNVKGIGPKKLAKISPYLYY